MYIYIYIIFDQIKSFYCTYSLDDNEYIIVIIKEGLKFSSLSYSIILLINKILNLVYPIGLYKQIDRCVMQKRNRLQICKINNSTRKT